jgi:hypothetical protein
MKKGEHVRVSIVIAIVLLASASSVIAEPAEIPFREVFTTLAEKTTRASDHTFFETEVLHGQARRDRDTSITDLEIWKYTYGPEARLGHASLIYANSGNKFSFTAFPNAADETFDCLTFAQADAELLRRGWSNRSEVDRGWLDVEDLGASYQRDGVTMNFVNSVLLLASAHSPESFKAQQESFEVTRQKRLQMTRGTDAYAKLCVNRVNVTYARQD